MISPLSEDFIFRKLAKFAHAKFHENKTLTEISEFTVFCTQERERESYNFIIKEKISCVEKLAYRSVNDSFSLLIAVQCCLFEAVQDRVAYSQSSLHTCSLTRA